MLSLQDFAHEVQLSCHIQKSAIVRCSHNQHKTKPSVQETKFLERSPTNRCLLYVQYKIPLAQLKTYLHWQVGEH